MKRYVAVILGLLLLISSLLGCTPGAPTPSSSEAPSSETEKTPSETEKHLNSTKIYVPGEFKVEEGANLDADITVVQALDMITFDPVNTSDVSNQYTLFNVYSRLFTGDEVTNGVPEICESYERVSDTEWHFKIYENVVTHDGKLITAEDVVYSLNRTKNGTAIGALFGPVLEINQVDEFTISITTDGPYPALPTALVHGACCIVPIDYCKQAEASGDWSHPIGSGRYEFVDRVIGDSISFKRFEDYYDQDDRALNATLTIKIIPEGSSRTIAIETGTADLNVDFDTADYDRALETPNVTLWEHFSQTVWHLGMDTTAEWFNNKLVRQAVNYAIDRAACLEVGHNGKGSVVYNCSTFAHSCLGAINNPLDLYSYDPVKAQQLMDEAGCPGFETEIIVFRDETERIATLCQAYLEVIGIKAKVVRIENAVFASYIADHKAPMFITSWGCFADPDLFLARRFGKAGIGGVNRGWYLNEELDALIIEGRSSFDPETRAQTYKTIQELMAKDAVEVDLYVSTTYALANKDLKGVTMNVERGCEYHRLHY